MNRSRTPVHSFNARLYAVLALAACFWLALIASIMLLALPNASDTHGTVDKALPDQRSSPAVDLQTIRRIAPSPRQQQQRRRACDHCSQRQCQYGANPQLPPWPTV